jgi:hypothetical protein
VDAAFVIIVVLGIGLVIVVGVFGYLQAKKRREALAAFAASRGWTYIWTESSLVGRFQGSPFGRGDDRRASNVIHGEHDGRPIVAFDYQYETTSGTGKDRKTTTHRFSVLAMSMGVVMPALAVEPEGFVGRMIGRLTNRDIELESEAFNRAFTVTCPDRKFAFDVLHPQMIEMLMQWPDLGWRFERDSMLVIRKGRDSIEEIDAKLVVMDAIIDRIPEFVWREVRGQ